MSEWISVKDRLPEEGRMVVTCGNGYNPAICCFYPRRGFVNCYDTTLDMSGVTHWQPCPVSPESEEEMSEKLPPVERSTVGSGTNFRSKTVNPQM